MITRRPLSRRTLLRGLGGVSIALPWLQAMQPRRAAAQTGARGPRRFVVFYSANGTIPSAWTPQGTGSAFTLGRILEPLTPHKQQLLVLSGVDMESARKDGANEHARGLAHMLTCTKFVVDKSLPIGGNLPVGYAGGISIDQELAKRVGGATRFRSLELGVATTKEWGAHPYSRMCYTGRLQPVPAEESPKAAFDRLFTATPAPAGGTGDLVRAQRKSVLDFVKEDFTTLSAQVGAEDRRTLDQHLTSVRELEKSIVDLGGRCTAAPQPVTVQGSRDNGSFPAIGKAHMDVLVAALACDATRVASLQWGSGQSGVVHNWVSAARGHHGISHEPNSNQGAIQTLIEINRWYATQLAYLGAALKARSEGGDTLLDNTVILWCSEVAVGNTHSFRSMPYVLLGSCGRSIKTGQHLSFNGTPHNNLMVALGRAMGADMTSFGDPALSTGTLPILV